MPKSFVVDSDTASDDAVALILAARTPGSSIRAVTTVAGNVPLDLATRNALVTLQLAGAGDVPVHPGLAGPLLRKLDTAQDVHGTDGMGGARLPELRRAAESEHAVDVLRRIARDEPNQHVLVTLGPLSNVATALLLDPELLTRFDGVFLMAGAFDGVGNSHPVGEYNVWADPEAASIVVAAPGHKTFIGWDVSRRHAVVSSAEQAHLRTLGPLGVFSVEINRGAAEFCEQVTDLPGYDLPDPIAMAVAIDPSIAASREPHHITIGVDEISRGGTFLDRRLIAPPPNGIVATQVDEAAFKAMLFAACSGPTA